MAGLTTAGFVAKRLVDVIASLESKAKAAFGVSFVTASDTPQGMLLRIIAAPLAELWELAQQLYDSFTPSNAEGFQLDNLCALVGVYREPATHSTVTLTLSGTPGSLVPAGSKAEATNGTAWLTDEEVTISGGGTIDVLARAEESGSIQAVAGSIDTVVSVVDGWEGVTNAADAEPGQDVETDAELRARRERSLQIVGAGPDGAIRAKLEQLDDIEAAVVISNRTLETDARGIPGAAFLTVLWPNTADQERIAQAIWETMPAGIRSYGLVEATVTDDQGYSQDVAWSWATAVAIEVQVDIEVDDDFPADGEDQVSAAVLVYAEALKVGDDVLPAKIYLAVLKAVSGLRDIDILVRKAGGSWTSDPVEMDIVELATIDSGDITVGVS